MEGYWDNKAQNNKFPRMNKNETMSRLGQMMINSGERNISKIFKGEKVEIQLKNSSSFKK